MMNAHRKVLVILVILVFQFVLLTPARACSGDFRQITLKEMVDSADLVLVATVTGSSDLTNPYDANYILHVESYLKGTGPDAVLITGFGTGGGDCLNDIYIGDRLTFFVDGDPAKNDILHASYVQVYDAVTSANEASITELTAITGQSSAPYATPIWTLLSYLQYSPVFRFFVLTGVPAAIISLALFIALCLRGEKRKRKHTM